MKLDPADIKVVAFDVHNTLAHWSSGGPRKTAFAIQQVLAKHGIELSYQSFAAARAKALTVDAAERCFDSAETFLRFLFERLGLTVPASVLHEVIDTYRRGLRLKLFEDSAAAVRAVHDMGYRTCTFTTLFEWAVRDALEPLWKHLDVYFDSHRAGHPKGHPGFYRGISRQLGVEPAQILAIGDEAEGDVVLPSQVGWRCVHLQRGGPAEAPPEAVAVVRNLGSFVEMLRAG
jgi:FMN phosphatase YigB (HAD superfamily)